MKRHTINFSLLLASLLLLIFGAAQVQPALYGATIPGEQNGESSLGPDALKCINQMKDYMADKKNEFGAFIN
ncbi:MAG: hypothetical protein Q7R83_04925, partial [bacterium]|nr:hypothetical protein [bacterium]